MVRRDGAAWPGALIDGKPYTFDDIRQLTGITVPAADGRGVAPLLATLEARTTVTDAVDAARSLIERGKLRPQPNEALAAPIPRPGKIICVGRNYAEHARELGNEAPERPILFAKYASAVVGPFDDVVRPREVDDLDYEAELCVVIGSGGRRITPQVALEHVAGYCCANDISARTAQLKSGDQWLRGKSFDTFCPIGPCLVGADEVADPQSLRIICRVDGEVRQDATTADMIFDVATLVSYCSDVFTLEPGDIVLTGTPPGVAMGRTPPLWLQPGQTVEVEIELIGAIANRVVAEASTAD